MPGLDGGNMDANATIVETRDLTKRYGNQIAVNNLTLRLQEGEIFGFLGPNGAGKTTTLLMLLGLTEPTAGSAWVCGYDPTRDPLAVKRVVGYLPEQVGFYDDMNARENLGYVARLNAMPADQAAERIEQVLRQVGLFEEGKKPVGAYSRGMRQRLGIAEVLLKAPRVVLLDEPTLGLDPDATLWMLDLIRSLSRDQGITVFFSSHLLDQVQRVSDRVGIMLKSSLAAVGPIEELAQQQLGLGSERVTLEEIYMRYFREGR